MYYPCSENNGVYQLRNYCDVDLLYAVCWFSRVAAYSRKDCQN